MAGLRAAAPGLAMAPQWALAPPKYPASSKQSAGTQLGFSSRPKTLSLSWSASFSSGQLYSVAAPIIRCRTPVVVQAAWTRRSKGQPAKNKKSWKQRTEKFFKPFMLNVFISSKYVHAKIMHRVTSRVVSVATTNARDLRLSLHALNDMNACKVIGRLIAERAIEADVYAVAFELRKGEKLEGKLAAVIDAAVEHGLSLV